MRRDKRQLDQLRSVKLIKEFISAPSASVLIKMGNTKVLCAASLEFGVPSFLENTGKGWITAEYGMTPSSTPQRKPRLGRTGRVDGRTYEIQRLIGRSLRAVVDLELLSGKTIWFDCDVLEADGGTRSASITGAFIVLQDVVNHMLKNKLLIKNPITSNIAAVSVGKVHGELMLDLSYREDSEAEIDLNVVMTEHGELVEIQGTAEKKPFSKKELIDLVELGEKGISKLIEIQKAHHD